MSSLTQSCIVASTLSLILIASMQIFKEILTSSKLATIFGGFLGSNLFVLVLTAISNGETILFGNSFQTNLFPEVVICLIISAFFSSLVHRVCFTVCIIFSLVALYYINRISDITHNYHQYNNIQQQTKTQSKPNHNSSLAHNTPKVLHNATKSVKHSTSLSKTPVPKVEPKKINTFKNSTEPTKNKVINGLVSGKLPRSQEKKSK
ncbi:unnamed protein product [Gordionus sp. m RMFG-2023]|uniref:protein KRTCAP2 homolog n=1 Tax=Gordionus sp. m RMFG-2023 TaxID=3053472 RepID=UPI0030DF7324